MCFAPKHLQVLGACRCWVRVGMVGAGCTTRLESGIFFITHLTYDTFRPTQARGFAFPGDSTKEWTHAWRAMSSLADDPAAMGALYSANHSKALEAVAGWAESSDGVPRTLFDKVDAFFKKEVPAHVYGHCRRC